MYRTFSNVLTGISFTNQVGKHTNTTYQIFICLTAGWISRKSVEIVSLCSCTVPAHLTGILLTVLITVKSLWEIRMNCDSSAKRCFNFNAGNDQQVSTRRILCMGLCHCRPFRETEPYLAQWQGVADVIHKIQNMDTERTIQKLLYI